MAHEKPNQLDEMFAVASELPAAERAIYLDRECAGKPESRRQIEDLLAHDQALDDLLEHPPWKGIAIEASADEGALPKSNNLDRLLAAACLDHPMLNTPSMVDAGQPRIDTNAETLDHSQQNVTGLTIDKKYRIDRVLGKGAMGAVYLATHLGTTRTVALKVINPEHAERDEFLIRFRREAVAAGSLRHPNIVNVTDFGVADLQGTQLPYLVMEYLDGQTLSDYLEQHGPMPLDQVVDVVDQIRLVLQNAYVFTAG